MDIPLTSLSWLDWLVTADWLLDHEQEKKAAYARRVGEALKKLTLAGVDVRAAVAIRVWNRPELRYRPEIVCGWPNFNSAPGNEREDKFGYFRLTYWTQYCLPVVGWVNLYPTTYPQWRNGEMRWVSPRRARKMAGENRDKIKWLSPADVHEPEKHVRFIRKFWRLVVIRASGVVEKEVVDG